VRCYACLRRPAVEAKAGISKTNLYSQIANGTFPAPIKLGPKAVGWLETDIDEWIAGRVRVSREERSNGR
jgi:prophage regulatory protein